MAVVVIKIWFPWYQAVLGVPQLWRPSSAELQFTTAEQQTSNFAEDGFHSLPQHCTGTNKRAMSVLIL